MKRRSRKRRAAELASSLREVMLAMELVNGNTNALARLQYVLDFLFEIAADFPKDTKA